MYVYDSCVQKITDLNSVDRNIVCKEDGSLKGTIYYNRKPTLTNQNLNFKLNHLMEDSVSIVEPCSKGSKKEELNRVVHMVTCDVGWGRQTVTVGVLT